MKWKRSRNGRNQRESAVITKAINDLAFLDGCDLLEEAGQLLKENPPAPETDRRIRETIAAGFCRKSRSVRRLFTLILVAAFMLVSTITAVAFWDEINHFWIDLKNQIAGYGPNQAEQLTEDWSGCHFPLYLPDGFKLIQVERGNKSVISIYGNQAGQTFSLRECPDGSGQTLDNKTQLPKESETEMIIISGMEGLLNKCDTATLSWGEQPFFTLQGDIDPTELIRIAESIDF